MLMQPSDLFDEPLAERAHVRARVLEQPLLVGSQRGGGVVDGGARGVVRGRREFVALDHRFVAVVFVTEPRAAVARRRDRDDVAEPRDARAQAGDLVLGERHPLGERVVERREFSPSRLVATRAAGGRRDSRSVPLLFWSSASSTSLSSARVRARRATALYLGRVERKGEHARLRVQLRAQRVPRGG